MKKLILITVGIIICSTLLAQKTDTTKIKLGETKIIILKDDSSNDKLVSHKVKKGETLYSISKQYNISIKELLENNPSLENKFEIGMILQISKRNKSNKTTIINKKKESDKKEKIKKLEQGLIEFEQALKQRKKEIKENEIVLDSITSNLADKNEDDLRKKEEIILRQTERKINELEKEITAFEKGIDDIEEQLENIEEQENNALSFEDWDFKTDYKWDKFSHKRKRKIYVGHWAGLELGLNNYMDDKYSVILDGDDVSFELNQDISWMVALNFIEYNIAFTNGMGLTTGMGTTWNSYSFRNNVNVYENNDGIITAEEDVINNYSKNSLNTWYLTVPLIFEFQIPIRRNRPGIHVGGGVVGSIKMHSERKTEYSDNVTEHAIKEKTDFQIPALKYGLTFRIGYKFISLFANYDIVPLFKKNRGPELFPFSVGIVLLDF